MEVEVKENLNQVDHKRIHVKLLIEGEIPGDKIIRAASLSFDKYCSVSKTLRINFDRALNLS